MARRTKLFVPRQGNLSKRGSRRMSRLPGCRKGLNSVLQKSPQYWHPHSKFAEEQTRQWLGKEIGDDVTGGTILNLHLHMADDISDEVIMNVKLAGSFTTGKLAIFH